MIDFGSEKIRSGFNDWFLLWSDVHLGRHARVRQPGAAQRYTADHPLSAFLLGYQKYVKPSLRFRLTHADRDIII